MSRGRHHYGTGHASTAGQLVRQSRNHNPKFNKVLPNTMEKLVSEGLFAPAGLDSDGHTTYKITALGRQRLADLQSKDNSR